MNKETQNLIDNAIERLNVRYTNTPAVEIDEECILKKAIQDNIGCLYESILSLKRINMRLDCDNRLDVYNLLDKSREEALCSAIEGYPDLYCEKIMDCIAVLISAYENSKTIVENTRKRFLDAKKKIMTQEKVTDNE